MTTNSSAMYSRNNNGPSTEPCGTPKTSWIMADTLIVTAESINSGSSQLTNIRLTNHIFQRLYGKSNKIKSKAAKEELVKYVTYLVVSSVVLDTMTGTCQPTNLPSLASDTSTSRGNSGIQTRNWMNLACRPYLTMTDADEDPRDSEPSRNTNPHDSDTFTTHTHTH